MTGKSDFTDEEWETVLEGPTSAGMLVAMSQRGGSVRESFSMAKAYGEARSRAGESQLLDEIAGSKPKVDKTRPHSKDEMTEHALGNLREALAVLEPKATPEEIDDYKQFIVGLAERVAEAHKGVGEEERAAIERIAETLGVDPPPAPAAS